MRLVPIVAALGIVAVTFASSGTGQVARTPPAAAQPKESGAAARPLPVTGPVKPQSIAWLRAGEAALAAGNLEAADDALETALVVDPRNREAYVALARVAQRQKLFGQAIRFTNRALALEPTDVVALGLQGEAMVQLGALPRARQNLARIREICRSRPCPAATSLAEAIQRGPAMAVRSQPATPAAPTPQSN